ncbi:MAG: DUF885 domain-containing protein [Pseudomonadota bacterium]|nr:DUF885 domain-containing protein [Pseudomonadota bacterium]
MIRLSRWALMGAVLILDACGARPPPQTTQTTDRGTQREHLNRIVERYWIEKSDSMPWYSWGADDMEFGEAPTEDIAAQTLADSLALEQRYLEQVLAVPRAALDSDSALTYDIFRQERALAIEGFTYPRELMPLNPYDALPQRFALMASAGERLALSTAQDYDDWRLRAMSFVRWTDQAIANMRDGMRRGYTLPRVLVERTLPQLAALGEDTPENVFYQPVRTGSTAANPEQARLADTLKGFLKEQILPSYRRLHDFMQKEYLPRARTSVGLSALPLGDAWYGHLVTRATGGTATAAQLHALGAAELERLRQRAQAVLAEASFAGNLDDFFEHMRSDPRFSPKTPAELLRAYQDMKVLVGSAAPALFASFPRAEFGIRGVETYRAPVAPALAYRPRAPNGMIAAVLYVNTTAQPPPSAALLPSQFLREAVPGYHYQLELQRERADLPKFRRFGGAPAFIEGWSLYAATLGDQLGLYHQPEERFGALLAQMTCAAALVIDPGLHVQGWTRQQAIDYLHAQLPMDDTAAADMVDRALARPAESLACSVGFLKIQELRMLAQQTLGARFDLRDFHSELLKNGAIPLDALETRMKSWLATGGSPAAAVSAGGSTATVATAGSSAGTADGAGESASIAVGIAPGVSPGVAAVSELE